MYWSRQYLSIDPKKRLPRPHTDQTVVHKLQKIVSMLDILETIKDKELGFQI